MLILVVIALVNLPLMNLTWTLASVERSGVAVQARIADAKNLGHANPIGRQQPAQVWARPAISPNRATNPKNR